jgi:MFS family permease
LIAAAAPEVLAVLTAKTVRTFCYGALGVVLPLHLGQLGLDAAGIGVAVTVMLIGSAVLTGLVRRPAERFGARAVLTALAALTGVAAALLLVADRPWLVVLAATLGNVAVGTGETGPFLTLEQVVVARTVAAGRRAGVLGLYNLVGYAAAAGGAAAVGLVPAWSVLFALFLAASAIQLLAYRRLPDSRPAAAGRTRVDNAARGVIRRLAALFALDAFAGGFVLQSLVAYFLYARFGADRATLALAFGGAQLLTAGSLLVAAPLAARFGLLATMVISHLASNILLVAIALAPSAPAAIALLWARHLLSQIDVPTRQAYLMAVVEDGAREAAASTTTMARTMAQAVSPALTGWVMQAVALSAPFALGGGLKIVYDLLLWWTFRRVPLRE